jgi:hypothetical protein
MAANNPSTTSSAPVVTINGFHLGGPLPAGEGDTIVFGVADWAVTPAAGTQTIDYYDYPNPITEPHGTVESSFTGVVAGLVESDGATTMPLGFASYTTVGSSEGPSNPVSLADIINDNIGPIYANAQALQNALAQAGGNITLNGAGVAADHEVDILVAYTTGTSINIADVTLTNTTGSAVFDTDALNPVVHDLVHIVTTLGLANLTAHNIDFLA